MRSTLARSLLGSLSLAVSVVVTLPRSAEAAVAYVRSDVALPWGSTTNEEAMDLVFGAGGWDDLRFETVNPAVLLSGTYTFIYLEGSDNNAQELEAFLMANQVELEAWVSSGGGLFLNAAPNEGGNQAWGFGGVTLTNGDFGNSGMAVDPAHPIWNGPNLPTALMFTGGSYAHASISGAGLVPHIVDDNGGDPNLAELLGFGMGRVMFGGLTTSNFWNPTPESLNLRANIIFYLSGNADPDMDGIIDANDNCPNDANPLQEDGDMDGVGDACDACPGDAINDPDGDMICAAVDNCPADANADQANADMDAAGDVCDPCPNDAEDDADGDMTCGDIDNCPDVVNLNQADGDMDGLGDVCDPCPEDPDLDADADGDGVCVAEDNCPQDANPDQADADGDGQGDACDPDGGTSGGDTTGTPGETGGDADTSGDPDPSGDSGTGGPIGGSTGSAGSGGATTSGQTDPGGCACAAASSSGGAGWSGLALVMLAAWRRRESILR